MIDKISTIIIVYNITLVNKTSKDAHITAEIANGNGWDPKLQAVVKGGGPPTVGTVSEYLYILNH